MGIELERSSVIYVGQIRVLKFFDSPGTLYELHPDRLYEVVRLDLNICLRGVSTKIIFSYRRASLISTSFIVRSDIKEVTPVLLRSSCKVVWPFQETHIPQSIL